jgi:hypothetical protein
MRKVIAIVGLLGVLVWYGSLWSPENPKVNSFTIYQVDENGVYAYEDVEPAHNIEEAQMMMLIHGFVVSSFILNEEEEVMIFDVAMAPREDIL